MRFPVYFLFFMSGFFYLTGNPFYNNASDTSNAAVNGKVAQLKYGRRVSDSSRAEKAEISRAKTAPSKPAPDAEPAVAAKVQESRMPTSAVASVQDPSLVPLSSTSEPAQSSSMDKPKTARSGEGNRKPLDWTVFGNKRKDTSLNIPVRARSQDEIDAEGFEDETRRIKRSKRLKSKSRAKKIKAAKAKSRKLKARKAARKAKKAKRLARLKRKNKSALRIARKAKKKPAKKKLVKKSRRSFGFSNVPGSGGTLTGG